MGKIFASTRPTVSLPYTWSILTPIQSGLDRELSRLDFTTLQWLRFPSLAKCYYFTIVDDLGTTLIEDYYRAWMIQSLQYFFLKKEKKRKKLVLKGLVWAIIVTFGPWITHRRT